MSAVTEDLQSRTLAIVGSTGSIGRQTVDVVKAHPQRFQVQSLAAGGSDLGLLAEQVAALRPEQIAVARGERSSVSEAVLAGVPVGERAAYRPDVLVGEDAATQVAGAGSDVVLNGITGSIGLEPTLAALRAGSTLALANKESLIVGGPLVTDLAQPGQIVPVDSEHSAIAQCLRGGRVSEVQRLVLTASGGPFRGWSAKDLAEVTPAQALKHPNFSMGTVITTNSATLVNKGLEVIEAHLLFGVSYEAIDVVVHPQQMIHSMVEFCDGSTIAQMGPPRMLVPIALGISWPERLPGVDTPCDWSTASQWQFEPLDEQTFPAVALARHVGREGATFPAVYNAANEVAVAAFHEGKISFPGIVQSVTAVVETHAARPRNEVEASSVEQVMAADQWARAAAAQWIEEHR